MPVDKKQLTDFSWNALRANSEELFSQLYQHYAENLYAFGQKFSVGDDLLQDAVQEVFVDLFIRSREGTVSIANLKAYLFVALKNNLLKKIARKKRLPTLTFDVYQELDFNITYDPQEQLIASELNTESSRKLQAAIQALSKKQKEIIYLKFEEGLDYPDIARVLQISVESARKQIYRALKSLRESFDAKELQTLLCIFFKKS